MAPGGNFGHELLSGFGHVHGYFVSFHSQNISFTRPGLADKSSLRSSCVPASSFESLPALPNTTKPKLPLGFWYLVRREGFEPSKAKPADLQSALVDHLSTDAYLVDVV